MSEPAIKIEGAHVSIPAPRLRKGGFAGEAGLYKEYSDRKRAENAAKRAALAKSIRGFFRKLFN
jgi:hypothetical protein